MNLVYVDKYNRNCIQTENNRLQYITVKGKIAIRLLQLLIRK